MKRITFFLLLVLPWLSAMTFSQTWKNVIKGTVKDSITVKPVEFSSVRILNLADSSFVKGTSTDEKGNFSIAADKGKYILEISFLGYKTLHKIFDITEKNPERDFGIMYLQESIYALNEAVITAQVPDIVVKGDTIEFNPAAYAPDENSLLKELVKNIPGIEIDEDGNLKANGKIINKIKVDGKEFFNNDIQMALNNLSANMIKKIQLFREETEESKVSGIKNSDGDQVLNLQVKDEYKKSVFGDVTAGYGNKDKYLGRGIVNMMRNDNQFSVITGANNTNQDIDQGGRRPFNLGYLELYGIDEKKEGAANFNIERSEDFSVNGNIRYSDVDNISDDRTDTEYINSETGNWFSTSHSKSQSNQKKLNGDVSIRWKPDSLTTIFYRASAGYSETESTTNSTNASYYINQNDTTQGKRNYINDRNGYNLQSSLNIGRRLNQKGRTVSLNIGGSLRDEDGKGFNKSLTTYTSPTQNNIELDQRLSSKTKNTGFNLSVSYLEPLTDKNSLTFIYSLIHNNSDSQSNRYNQNEYGDYTEIDTTYSRSYDNRSISQRFELGFQSLHEKYEYNIGFNIEPYYSKNKSVTYIDSLEIVKQNIVNYSPRIRLVYKFSKERQLNFHYQGTTRQPTSDQLSSRIITLSPTSIRYGNPNLKPGYDNHINFYYQQSDYEKQNYLFIRGSFRNTINQIVSYSKVDSLLNYENTYKNVSGNWGADFSVSYNMPIIKDKLTFSTTTNNAYNRRKSFINGMENTSRSLSFYENLFFNFRSSKIDSRLTTSINYNTTKNSLQEQNNIETSRLFVENMTTWRLPADFQIINTISYMRKFGYSSEFNNSQTSWNASISKKFLKKKMGTLRIDFHDILKDQNDTERHVGSGQITDMRTNIIGRYFLASFTYRFNIAKGNTDGNEAAYY